MKTTEKLVRESLISFVSLFLSSLPLSIYHSLSFLSLLPSLTWCFLLSMPFPYLLILSFNLYFYFTLLLLYLYISISPYLAYFLLYLPLIYLTSPFRLPFSLIPTSFKVCNLSLLSFLFKSLSISPNLSLSIFFVPSP